MGVAKAGLIRGEGVGYLLLGVVEEEGGGGGGEPPRDSASGGRGRAAEDRREPALHRGDRVTEKRR